MKPIDTAKLDWDDSATPLSIDYGDFYFSLKDGLLESEYVFLQHNGLADRFHALENKASSVFTIVETGFGTGLNFSLTLELWQRHAPPNARLRFISIEKHPLTLDDLKRAYQHWPRLADIAASWQAAYPPIFPGQYVCNLGSQVQLHLAFGDISTALDELHRSLHNDYKGDHPFVDAWFLDGFSPSKNPAMWQPSLFRAMAELSQNNATFSTFTAASNVRRQLIEAGFEVEKVTGYGGKREMLCGIMKSPNGGSVQNIKNHNAAWYLPPKQPAAKKVAVIGAGIAGATIANALAKKGLTVVVFDGADTVASHGSGNLQGVIYGKLSHRDELSARFVTSALHFASQYYQSWFDHGYLKDGIDGAMCGVAHLLDKENPKLQQAFTGDEHFVSFHSAHDISQKAGIDISKPAMFVRAGGWLYPRAFCKAALTQNNIETRLSSPVESIVRDNDGWLICNDTFDAVVIASGCSGHDLTRYLPIKPIRGQVSHLQHQPKLSKLAMAICDKGYLAPAMDNTHCIGASFNLGLFDDSLRDEDHQNNLDNLKTALPVIAEDLPAPHTLSGRVAYRGTSPDYLPLVGNLVDPYVFQQDFAHLGKDATLSAAISNSYLKGAYCFQGLGSKGLAYAPICAEHLASTIAGEGPVLPLSLQMALNPNRFLLRSIIKNKPLTF